MRGMKQSMWWIYHQPPEFLTSCNQHLVLRVSSHCCRSAMKCGLETSSTLDQVTVCCLKVPSHYLSQCWFIITVDLWHSHASNLKINVHKLNPNIWSEITLLKPLPHLPGANALSKIRFCFCLESYLYQYPSEYFHWHRNNRMISPMSVSGPFY